jgi:hypothetical protein
MELLIFLICTSVNRLRFIENGILRTIFGPNREDLTQVCRKLRNKELHNFYLPISKYYYFDDQIRKDKMDCTCSTQGR